MTIAVLLGNRNNNDGTMSNATHHRVELALELINANTIDKLILSGGIANGIAGVSEASVMRQYLISHGVAEDMLIMEEKSLTTKQNAYYSAKIISQYDCSDVIIVTDRQHMQRSTLNPIRLFRKALGKEYNVTPYKYGEQHD